MFQGLDNIYNHINTVAFLPRTYPCSIALIGLMDCRDTPTVSELEDINPTKRETDWEREKDTAAREGEQEQERRARARARGGQQGQERQSKRGTEQSKRDRE